MTKQRKTGSRPWWSYAALSMRGLIALIVVFALGLAWISIPASRQRNAVCAIEKSGGKVWYESPSETTPSVVVRTARVATAQQNWTDWAVNTASAWRERLAESVPSWPPGWLVESLGTDYFNTVVSVSLTHRATDAELIRVANLKRVERVDLHGCAVTAAGLARLKTLPRLHTLLVVRTKIGDAELAQLALMTNLQVLSLEGTELNDQGLSLLRNLTNLNDLDLASTRVSDSGLEHLMRMNKLQALNLSRTEITDAGLAYLENLTGLQELSLGRTKVTDAGLTHFKGLTNLVELTLDRTSVSDAGLEQIKELNQLATLSLDRTRVSDAGIARLQLHRAAQLANQGAVATTAVQQPPRMIPKLEIVR